jgi:flagellar biosynthesis protein FlhA
VGDGLVSQIPALIISTSAAMIVTRATSEDNLGSDLSEQLTRYPRALLVGAAMLAIIGLVPGMPTIPFLVVSALVAFAGLQSQRLGARREAFELAAEQAGAAPEKRKRRAPKTIWWSTRSRSNSATV